MSRLKLTDLLKEDLSDYELRAQKEFEDLLEHIAENDLSGVQVDNVDELEEVAEQYWNEFDGDFDFYNMNKSGDLQGAMQRMYRQQASPGDILLLDTNVWSDSIPMMSVWGDDTLITYDAVNGYGEYYIGEDYQRLNDIYDAAGLGPIVEDMNWHDGIDLNDAEDVANRITEIDAIYVPFSDHEYYPEEVASHLSAEVYDGDKIAYTIFYDVNDGVIWFITSTGLIQDVTDWEEEELEMVQNAAKYNRLDEGVSMDISDLPPYPEPSILADILADAGARYVELTNMDAIRHDIENDVDFSFINDDIRYDLQKLYKRGESAVYTYVPELERLYVYDGEQHVKVWANWKNDSWTDDEIEMIKDAGEYGRADESLNESGGMISVTGPEAIEDLANKFAERGMEYIHLDVNEWDALETVLKANAYVEEKAEKEGKDPSKAFAIEPKIFDNRGNTTAFLVLAPDKNVYYYVEGSEPEMDLIRGAGELNESVIKEEKAWDDGINWNDRGTIAEQLADRLAEIGAGYYDLSVEDLYEYPPDDWDKIDEIDHAAEVLDQIGKKLDQYPLLYSYYKAENGEFVIIFSDGTYLTAQDWDKDDLEMVKDAGMYGRIDEEVDKSDERVTEMLKAYANGNFELANPDPERNGQSLFSDTVIGADYQLYCAAENKNFPAPIHEYAKDVMEADYYKEVARERAVEGFYNGDGDNFDDLAKEFYGLEDEIDAEMLRDAGYDDAADWWEQTEKNEIEYRLEDEYSIELLSSVEFMNHRGKEVLYQIVQMSIKDQMEGEDVMKVIYQTRDEYDSVERHK